MAQDKDQFLACVNTRHGARQSSIHVRHAIKIPCSGSVKDILHLLLLLLLKKKKRILLCDVIENILLLFMKMFIVHMTMWWQALAINEHNLLEIILYHTFAKLVYCKLMNYTVFFF